MHNYPLLNLHVTDLHVDACDQGDEGDVDGKDVHDAAVQVVLNLNFKKWTSLYQYMRRKATQRSTISRCTNYCSPIFWMEEGHKCG